jgi:hypothetical protein
VAIQAFTKLLFSFSMYWRPQIAHSRR